MNAKENMRSMVLARRDALDEKTRARKSTQVCGELRDMLEAGLCTRAEAGAEAGGRRLRMAVYAAMRSELSLQPLVEHAYARGWDVCFPCMVRDRPNGPSRMEFYLVPVERLEQARETFLGQPLRCRACEALAADGFAAVKPVELDAVVVPLVAFDDAGRRLGYGGGNYDRLLPRLRPDALVAGAAFAEQRVDAVPCEPHDRPLPRIASA